MSNLNSGGSTTTSITTIAAPEAPAEAPETAAPASGGDTTPASKPTVAPSADENLRIAKRYEKLAQSESKFQQQQREAREAKAEADRVKAEYEKRIAELEEEGMSDPVGYMLKKGMDPQKIAERYARPESPEEKRIRLLEEKLTAREQKDIADAEQRKKDQEAFETKQQEAARTKAEREFIASFNTKDHPNFTSLYAPRDVPRLVGELLMEPADPTRPNSPTMLDAYRRAHGGKNPTDGELREVLEYRAWQRATRILERQRAASAQSNESPTQGSPKGPAGTSGISNQHAAVTTSAKQARLSREEDRKKRMKELTAALEREPPEE